MTEGKRTYKINKWKKRNNFECAAKGCAFSTLDRARMVAHVLAHQSPVKKLVKTPAPKGPKKNPEAKPGKTQA